MSHSRATLALLSLLFVGRLASPAPAAAGSFAPLWTLTGWDFVQDVGNTDGDPQRELLFSSRVDGHVALVDGLTGVIAKEFPEFKTDNTALTTADVDGDGRLELFFWRPANGAVTPLVTGYDWNGASYATLFSHTDPADYWSLLNVRDATTLDAIELSGTDVCVRDLSGTVIFRASTAVPGWSGDAPSVVTMDIDQDGVLELGAVEHIFTAATKVSFFNYAGGFTPAWSVTGWQALGQVNSDGDPQPEIVMFNGADGRYALFDGVSGAMERDFPGFSFFDPTSFNAVDIDGDGAEELFFSRPENLPTTRLFTAYEWSAGSYTPVFSHTERVDSYSFAHLRSASQYDVLEQVDPALAAGEFRVRDLTGGVLFRASTQIPGWSGIGMFAAEVDTDHDGIIELAINDHNTTRFVRYSGTAFVQSWFTPAWSLQVELPNIDGDPQTELVVVSNADQHFAILDTPSGALEQEFPAFTTDDSYILPIDTDSDDRLELFFARHYFAPQLCTGYDWTPSGYATLFSHTDALEGFGNGHFRTPGSTEFVELAPNDLRVRDMSGVVLFLASTDLPGWTGVGRDASVIDVNGDGVSEILAIDAAAVRLVHGTGTTSVTNPVAGDFQLLASAPNPFRTGTAFRFSTRAAGNVGIRVFDASGRLVRRLDEHMTAGPHEVHWDGRDEQGRPVPSGMLFYDVTADGTRRSGRMVRLGR